MKTTLQYPIMVLCVLSFCCSCNKLVQIPESKNQIATNYVFADSNVAVSALLGIYYTLGTPASAVSSSMKYISMYADEYTYTAANGALLQFNQGKLGIDNGNNATLWNNLYSTVYQCNSLIEGVNASTALSPKIKTSLKAEAKFLRAFAYFYLVQLYDHIPLILGTDVDQNKQAGQTDPANVIQQIEKDLTEAYAELGTTYVGTGKVRANKWAAAAMLARLYLYQHRWTEAEQTATALIAPNNFSPLPALELTFQAASKETILQFWCANGLTGDATTLIPATSTALPQYVIHEDLLKKFEATDGRKSKWITTNTVITAGQTKAYAYPSKYKNRTANAAKPEFLMALRLSEQYLIRAEALANLGQFQKAIDDVNIIRARATGIAQLPIPDSKEDCLAIIARERRLELFGEWGHRFLDLKRSAKIDEVLGPLKPNWQTGISGSLPIPNTEIIYNKNLKQNYGY